ncbi:MAG: hypothetical protein Q4C70_08100 [Planctomycetia bacterium]|nr:hypothetical protein [Planctomycetia bacterium]
MERAPIAVFYALEAESGALEDRLTEKEYLHTPGFKLISGKLKNVPFLVVRTGAGVKNARNAVENVCRIHQPRLVISAGFAGALDYSLPKYALFFPSEFISESSSSESNFSVDTERLTLYTKLTETIFSRELRKECHFGGRLLTVGKIIAETQEKKRLGASYQARAVEMETYSVAEFCEEVSIPFLAVRAISDDVERELPKDMQKLVEQKTTVSRLGAAFQMILQRPRSVQDMFQLYGTSIHASTNLADAISVLAESELFSFLAENFFPPQKPGKLIA